MTKGFTWLAVSFLLMLTEMHGAQFSANLDPAQVVITSGAGPNGSSPFTGTSTADYQLSVADGPLLFYTISLPGMDLDGNRTPGNFSDDVTAIHLHFGTTGANGPHALNVFGLSAGQIRNDDANMTFNSANSTVSGRWDDMDQLFSGAGGTRMPFDSVGLSAATNDLFGGGLYFQVHTLNFPNGELRGQLLPVPEPGVLALIGMGLLFSRKKSAASAIRRV